MRTQLWVLAGILLLTACGEPQEPPRVELEVFTDASGLETVVTDLGYEVELTEARLVLENLEFTIAGELHSSILRSLSQALLPTAHAHPGHHQDGDVTGELRGRFIIDWTADADAVLGNATLLAGDYKAANFSFERGAAADGLAEADPLLGHTAILRGRASKDGERFDFVARIVSPVGRTLVGAPFEMEIDAGTDVRLGVRLLVRDAIEEDTLFDGLDFSALAPAGDAPIVLEGGAEDPAVVAAYNRLRSTFQTHDHFDVSIHGR